jgi:SSS family solute:Na+ symporter
LAGRSLPWWLVGLSMYATAIDSSDLVADSGGTYTLGFSVFVANWVGVVGGWALAAFFVFLPM